MCVKIFALETTNPHTGIISHLRVTICSLPAADRHARPAGAMPSTSMLMAPPSIASMPLQLPTGNVLAYQQGLAGQSQLLAHGVQTLQHAGSGHAATSPSADLSSPVSAEKRASSRGGGSAGGGTTSAATRGGDTDKVTERRARRCALCRLACIQSPHVNRHVLHG